MTETIHEERDDDLDELVCHRVLARDRLSLGSSEVSLNVDRGLEFWQAFERELDGRHGVHPICLCSTERELPGAGEIRTL